MRLLQDGVTGIEQLEDDFKALSDRFTQRFPGEPAAAMFQSQVAVRAGRLARTRGLDGNDEALRHFKSAEQVLRTLPADVLSRPEYQSELSLALSEQAKATFDAGEVSKALEIQRRSITSVRSIVAQKPSRKNRIDLIRDARDLGVYLKESDLAAALVQLQDTLKSAEELSKSYIGDAEIRRVVRDCVENLATGYRKSGQPDVAAEMLRKRLNASIGAKLDSIDMETLLDQAFVHANLGRAYEDLALVPEALSQFRKACELRQEIRKRDPKNLESVSELLKVCQALGDVARRSASTSEQSTSLACLDTAFHLVDAQAEADSFDPKLKESMVIAYFQCGSLALSLGSPSSLGHFTRCKALAQSLPGFPPARLADVERLIQAAKQLPDGV